MLKKDSGNDPQEILTQAIEQMKVEQAEKFDLQKVNLAELERRTGITRAKLRRYKKDDFVIKPHGNTGRKAEVTVLSGFTGVIDELLRNNVTNSIVCYERIAELGYSGGQTQVRVYIEQHQDLIPPKRQTVSPQGNRGRRYETGPGEAFQMDWGFVEVETGIGTSYQAACFAMICHHCGSCYVEFFPNARQESLFIGMIHAFYFMGIPRYILTDNMKSVVIRRDPEGHPMHPFTKGKVERLIRFVKDNFLAGRVFSHITDLNIEAVRWCLRQNSRYHKAVDCVPEEKHGNSCRSVARVLELSRELSFYLCPLRIISFDGFVNYEGRRFGVPYWYTKRVCRIQRRDYELTIYDDELSRILTKHDVTWSHRAQYCRDQYALPQPEEYPSMPVRSKIFEIGDREPDSAFSKFNFEEGLWND